MVRETEFVLIDIENFHFFPQSFGKGNKIFPEKGGPSMKIKIFGPGCIHCLKLELLVAQAA